MLKSARVSEDSSIGERKRLRFLLRKREKEKALAATVRVTKAPASLVAVRKSETSVIVTASGSYALSLIPLSKCN
ncbi:hypothetical protein L195_g042111 [Trifolium pratense]|uniref:Uncharacterized protein n=1 Tax=Trifolium pratense TaxID=57577 RepID=A0A2K3M5H4_TRIPR|nr:hypothetical protein L195_g042111 [Trifolium pratense]